MTRPSWSPRLRPRHRHGGRFFWRYGVDIMRAAELSAASAAYGVIASVKPGRALSGGFARAIADQRARAGLESLFCAAAAMVTTAEPVLMRLVQR